jgi:hypothetical protein
VPVVIAQNLLDATTHLRAASYSLAIFDCHLIEAEPYESGTALAHLGEAVPLDINFAITGIDRLVQEVQSALKRRERDQATARAAAAHSLYSGLNGTLTALLLDCGLASEIPGLPLPAAEKLASIREAAQKLLIQLETAATLHD